MLQITYAEVSQHSGAQSAVAVVQTNWTGSLSIIIILSSLMLAGRRFASLYINVDFEAGNVEQTLPLKSCPLNCKQSLTGLLAAKNFKTTIIEPVVLKVLEEQKNARGEASST